jgi:hypothetical protein
MYDIKRCYDIVIASKHNKYVYALRTTRNYVKN